MTPQQTAQLSVPRPTSSASTAKTPTQTTAPTLPSPPTTAAPQQVVPRRRHRLPDPLPPLITPVSDQPDNRRFTVYIDGENQIIRWQSEEDSDSSYGWHFAVSVKFLNNNELAQLFKALVFFPVPDPLPPSVTPLENDEYLATVDGVSDQILRWDTGISPTAPHGWYFDYGEPKTYLTPGQVKQLDLYPSLIHYPLGSSLTLTLESIGLGLKGGRLNDKLTGNRVLS